ncbi:MAG: 50S ribosomal protein L30 [Euryarchaeota archaeon]|nr:50S ribosomal protein L30 [Euryarchaeota archaeon]
MTYAVVRIRGQVNLNGEIRDTMRYLRLTRANHCVLLPQNPTVEGMLRRAKDYVTWGEIEPSVVRTLLAKRARLVGDQPIDDAYLKKNTKFASVAALAEAVAEGKVALKEVPGIKPVLRLHPPRGGYEGTKRGYRAGGALGYRGKDINPLLLRMLGPEES